MTVMILADERNRTEYLRTFAYVKGLSEIAFRFNGYPFGLGLHNSVNIGKLHGKEEIALMKSLRDKFDPKKILNPCKTTDVRIPGIFTDLSMEMMRIAPELVMFGLETANYAPLDLIRFGLRIIGGSIR